MKGSGSPTRTMSSSLKKLIKTPSLLQNKEISSNLPMRRKEKRPKNFSQKSRRRSQTWTSFSRSIKAFSGTWKISPGSMTNVSKPWTTLGRRLTLKFELFLRH
jgi:hypothetical protein